MESLTNPNLLSLRPGPATGPRELRGLWFRVGHLQAPPPRNLSELPRHLRRSPAEGLGESSLRGRREDQRPPADGRCGHHPVRVATARAHRPACHGCAEGVGDKVEAAALVAEPNDERTLRLRAGPDAEVLKGRQCCPFWGRRRWEDM